MKTIESLIKKEVVELGDYLIIDYIGTGCFGYVFKAINKKNNQLVAIKGYSKAIKNGFDEQIVYSELKNIIDLMQGTDYLVSCQNVIRHDFNPYLVMDYIHGMNLRSIEKNITNFDSESKLNIIIQIVLSVYNLHFAFLRGHGDLKPENILISEIPAFTFGRDDSVDDTKSYIYKRSSELTIIDPNYVYLTDFGLSTLLNSTKPMLLGDQNYRDPSLNATTVEVSSSDLYSLSIIIFEFLTGVHPFTLFKKSTDVTEWDVLEKHLNDYLVRNSHIKINKAYATSLLSYIKPIVPSRNTDILRLIYMTLDLYNLNQIQPSNKIFDFLQRANLGRLYEVYSNEKMNFACIVTKIYAAHISKAERLMKIKSYDEAASIFAEVLERNLLYAFYFDPPEGDREILGELPLLPVLRSHVCRLYAHTLWYLNKIELSKKFFEEAVRLDSNNIEAQITFGSFLIEENIDVNQGLNIWDAVKSKHPENEQLLKNYCTYFALINENDMLYELLNDYTSKHGDVDTSNYFMGIHYLRAGKFANAIPYFENDLSINSNDVATLNNLITCYIFTNKIGKALERFKIAAKFGKERPATWLNLFRIGFLIKEQDFIKLSISMLSEIGYLNESNKDQVLGCHIVELQQAIKQITEK